MGVPNRLNDVAIGDGAPQCGHGLTADRTLTYRRVARCGASSGQLPPQVLFGFSVQISFNWPSILNANTLGGKSPQQQIPENLAIDESTNGPLSTAPT